MRIWNNGLRFLSWDTSRASRQPCGPLGRHGDAVTTNGPSVPGLMALSGTLPRACFREDWVISVSKNPGEHWTSSSSSFSHWETEACKGNGWSPVLHRDRGWPPWVPLLSPALPPFLLASPDSPVGVPWESWSPPFRGLLYQHRTSVAC